MNDILAGAGAGILFAASCLIPAATAQETPSTFTDPRDGREYGLVRVGDMTWFSENLNYAAAGSYCYDHDEAACAEYGRLYPWEIALSACPAGWHLSSDFEWQILEMEMGVSFLELNSTNERGDAEEAGLRTLSGGDSGLDMRPGGWGNPDLTFERGGVQAALWTSTEADAQHAWHRDVGGRKTGIWRSRVYKPYALSARCVKDWLTPETIGEWHKIEE